MAKVLISMPDELLRRVDEAAGRRGETRSGFMQRLAEREIAESNASLRKELEDLFDLLPPAGGESGRWIRADRDHRDDKWIRRGRDQR